MSNMQRVLTLMAERGASDMFMSAGAPVLLKISGQMVPVSDQLLPPAMTRAMIAEVMPPASMEELDRDGELNTSVVIPNVGSFRFSAFRQRNSIAAVVRCIPARIPSLESLKVPSILGSLILEKRGLLLMVGATGTGKSTTLAAMIEWRNQSMGGHILTIEDPIEFLYTNKRSIVNQREVGKDTASLYIGLKNAMRQAPDVILIGEIRDRETMAAAISYSLSGHLVLATMHANNSYHALGRVLSFYPPESRPSLLSDLSSALKSVISQRLLKAVGGGRAAAVEVLINTPMVAELIEKGDFLGVRDAMSRSLSEGSQTYEQDLARLIKEGRITREEALIYADSPTNLMWRLENETPVPTNKANAKKAAEADADSQPTFTEITLDVLPPAPPPAPSIAATPAAAPAPIRPSTLAAAAAARAPLPPPSPARPR
ncbi:twitching motility protein PilT [Vitreoscilla filiformis]|uniref:Twitching motility protein PilT n=1 Tax=Vitreoscilla filiformis TaxID=63 RepID=A0A221KEZ3_VITFI|nr:PilT/PilU family type 4a pilus ATPase [Vitreoscilla filiformis]ASM77614.1 twitching motility protein PilT [Vitreoscilla filiformis]